jgi:hypothetical protein
MRFYASETKIKMSNSSENSLYKNIKKEKDTEAEFSKVEKKKKV